MISDGQGEIILKQGMNNKSIRLKNVLHVPDIGMNLLSVAKITDHGYNVKFDKNGAVVYRTGVDSKLTAVRQENAYYVRSLIMNDEEAAVTEDMNIWHKRLGHANKRVIEDMKKENLVTGIQEDSEEKR